MGHRSKPSPTKAETANHASSSRRVTAGPVLLSPSKETDPIVSLPPSSPRGLDTLLPGYASRPQPSPVKPISKHTTEQATTPINEPNTNISLPRVEDARLDGGLCNDIGDWEVKKNRKPLLGNIPAPTLLELATERRKQREPNDISNGVSAAIGGGIHAPVVPPAVILSVHQNAASDQQDCNPLINIPKCLSLSLPPECLASIPLPNIALQFEAKFRRIIAVYDFFQRHHIQSTWQALEQSMRSAGVDSHVTLDDLHILTTLCPHVIHVAPHLSASDDPQQRFDDWRQQQQPSNGNTPINNNNEITNSAPGGLGIGGIFDTAIHPVFDGSMDLIVTLSDPWEIKYSENEGPPRIFLEEAQAREEMKEREGATLIHAADEVLDGEESGDALFPTTKVSPSSAGVSKKRRPVQSNKRIRMEWELRKALILNVAYIQERHFKGNVPPVSSLAALLPKAASRSIPLRKKRVRPTRRSKAGQRAQAAAASFLTEDCLRELSEVISLLDDDDKEAPMDDGGQVDISLTKPADITDLDEILALGRWHPAFPIDTAVTNETIKQAAQAIQNALKHQESGKDISDVRLSNNNNIDALAAARAPTESPSEPKMNTQRQSSSTAQKSRSRRPAAPPQLLKKHPPCTDTTTLSATAFLEHLKSLPGYQNQVVHVEQLPARAARYAVLDPPILPPVLQALEHRGVRQFYSHQTEAITSLRSGQHTVVATSTASGKSLCYVVPILEALVKDPAACAVLIFPTKALAQDQLRAIRGMCSAAFGDAAPGVDIYDGDTPMGDRGDIRDRAQILLTNPDMLHQSILPVHNQFGRMLSNLKYCVVDEAHTYKGVFGCHSAFVLRRLRRVCSRIYNIEPIFAVTTATVANPKQHACTLLGVQDVVVVQEDGSPHGPKDFVLWNPPLMNKQGEGANNCGGGQGGKGRKNFAAIKAKEVQEAKRIALRVARQERSSGVILGPETCEKDWVVSVGAGQRDPVVKERFDTSKGNSPLKKQKIDNSINSNKQQDDDAQMMTARQRKLVSEAVAALSAASGPLTDPTTLAKLKQVDATGAVVGTRRLIKVGPELGTSAVDALGHKKKGGIRDSIQNSAIILRQSSTPSVISPTDQVHTELPTGLESKASKIRARVGTTGVDPDSARSSPIVEMASLLAETIQHGLRSIAFCKTRKLSELVTAYVREILAVTAPELRTKVAVYRAGYSATERREIEAALFSGSLLGVAATNALELGVDIGGLDATLHLGFPGSIASLWQQAGRAGRREQPSISIYVGWDGPLDQYFLTNPSNLFSRPIESAMVDISNPAALQAHAACAAFESQLHPDADAVEYFGPGLNAAVHVLQSKGVLGRNLLYTGSASNPASTIALRAIDPNRYSIIDESALGGGKLLEEVEENKAFYQVHDGSTYFFQGRTYLCRKLDLDARVALMRPVDVKYYTKTVDFTAVQLIGGGESIFPNGCGSGNSTRETAAVVGGNQTELSGSNAVVCPQQFLPTSALVSAATVTTRWLGFVRVWRGTGQVFDSVNLFLPDVQYQTEAAYIRLPPAARRAVEAAGLPFRDGVHAAAHAVLNALPLFLMANPQDIGTECDNPYDTQFKPERILLYDKYPGGIGLVAAARPRFTELLSRALSMISACSCSYAGGCPGCCQHTDCGEYNSVLNKEAGRLVLKTCLEIEAEKYGLNNDELGI